MKNNKEENGTVMAACYRYCKSRSHDNSCHRVLQVFLIICMAIVTVLRISGFEMEDIPVGDTETMLCTTFMGGFGNNIFQFASAFAIARSKDMTFVVARNSLMNRFFALNNLRFSENEKFCKNQPERVENGSLFATYDPSVQQFSPGQNLRIGNYLQSWKYFDGFESDIKKQLVFRERTKTKVNNTIYKIMKKYSIHSRSEATLVGVHVRRGDMVENPLGFTVAPADYIQKAVYYFFTKYKNVIFVVASNDMEWTKQHMPKYVNSVYIVGTRDYDMATLASCDHTIMTVGTFGWWCGFLAGGEVVYAKHPAVNGSWWYEKMNTKDYYYPHWIAM